MGTESDKAPTPAAAPADASSPALRVIIADSQAIYRVGIRKIVALEDDIRVVAQAETLGQTLSALSKFGADVLLFDTQISPNPAEAISEILKRVPSIKIIVLASEMAEDQTVEMVRRGIRGLLTRAVAPELLVKCVRKVAQGETWLDNQGVNWVLEAYRAQASQLNNHRPKARLSDKDLLILSCVTQGMRNKEIAGEIGTTEQVVKNYLRKIYDKLGVSDRLELALYCMHHRLLDAQHAVRRGPANGAAAVPQPERQAAAAAADGPPKQKIHIVE
jgi:DNA-binding NarL/FixJ family response regulator